MGLIDLSADKPVPDTLGDASQVANGFQAIQDVLNGGVDDLNFAAGKIFDPAKLMQKAATDGEALVWDAASSAWKPATVARTLARKNSTTDVVNTAVATDMCVGALVIPAGAMGATGLVKVSAFGDFLNNTGGAQTINIALNFGASSSSYGLSTGSGAARQGWAVEWWVVNQGATNSQQQGGAVTIFNTPFAVQRVGTAIDTTAPVTAQVQAAFAVANASLSLRCHGALLQVFPA